MGKVVEIDCENPMKLETSPKVTKSKRSLHWCPSISKKISVQVLLQYQSKSYYIIGQEVYYSIGRFITLSGSYYIIGRFLLHYRAVITVSGVYYIIGWYSLYSITFIQTRTIHLTNKWLSHCFRLMAASRRAAS